MKLYILIFLVGDIVAWTGPLPYDMNECKIRTEEIRRKVEGMFDIECSFRYDNPDVDSREIGIIYE